MLVYTVVAELPSAQVAREFLDWLADDHLREVVDAGALEGEAVLLERDGEDAPHVVECRYRFADRAAFDAYEAGPAEALRADGRARFADRVRFRRTIGEQRIRRP
ncbi:MAG TPA: DUF4286 family protein [Sandaracinaceae bacterium LLY-WYZ-13_1]|nr:DUF4286 family protein [Sandaracinaceae bacterium LLY-WYZ-13_1]